MIFLVSTTSPLTGMSLGIGGGAGILISRADRFDPKPQFEAEAAAELLFPLTSWLAVGAMGGIRSILPSDARGGYAYRGYSAAMIGMEAEIWQHLGSWTYVGTFRAIQRAGIDAAIATYDLTSLSFFFPSIRLEGSLEFIPAAFPFLKARIAIPGRMDFRKDMAISGSIGLRLGLSLSTGGGA